jgi:hypothetical protein
MAGAGQGYSILAGTQSATEDEIAIAARSGSDILGSKMPLPGGYSVWRVPRYRNKR